MPVNICFGDYLYDHKITYSPKGENAETVHFVPHLHLVHEIIYFISGKIKLITEGTIYIPKQGDIIFIPAKHYHVTEIVENETYERIVLNLPSTPFIDGLLSVAFGTPKVINTANHPDIPQFFARLENYHSRFDEEHFKILFEGLFNEFLLLCTNKKLLQRTQLAPSEKILDEALEYINKNLATIGNVEEIADHVFVSSSYIYQLFQKNLHISPKKLLASKRLSLAKSCISSGESPYSVYQKCGYADYSTFYRAYKAYFGHSPSKES